MPDLFLYNSQSRLQEKFTPINPSQVRLYVCGPTVYDLAHLGNARTNVVFDVMTRLLRSLYPDVLYIRNLTDVDDKINARAQESGETIEAITRRTTSDFHTDMARLGNLPPDAEPRATAHIGDMIALIEKLLARGHAYAASSHVLFAVESDPHYGSLSGRDATSLQAGARVEIAPYKRHPGDFVLWKPSDDSLPGWASPWGRGRPGWHIECSAMAWRYLGQDFDIHGGGRDLLFPHHENECAQSRCAFPGSHFARFWMHSGMLLVDGEKMSKSLGNFRTLRDVLAVAPAEAVRLLLLRSHYRADLAFSDAALQEARQEMDRFYRALQHTPVAAVDSPPPISVMQSLCDDLNTPLAISKLHALADRAMTGDVAAAVDLQAGGALMGLFHQSPDSWFRGRLDDTGWIDSFILLREDARRTKDFPKADSIRAKLLEKGVVLEDKPDGVTIWRRI